MKAFRIALVNINLDGEYEDCCTLYINEERTKEMCYNLANELKKFGYKIKLHEGQRQQFAKICKQHTTINIIYECEHKNGEKQYIGYTTYILK